MDVRMYQSSVRETKGHCTHIRSIPHSCILTYLCTCKQYIQYIQYIHVDTVLIDVRTYIRIIMHNYVLTLEDAACVVCNKVAELTLFLPSIHGDNIVKLVVKRRQFRPHIIKGRQERM